MLYDFAGIEALRIELAANQGALNQRLDELKSAIAPLVAEWEGDAATSYQDKQRQWDLAAAELNAVLDAIGRAVDDGNREMQAREAINRSMFT